MKGKRKQRENKEKRLFRCPPPENPGIEWAPFGMRMGLHFFHFLHPPARASVGPQKLGFQGDREKGREVEVKG